MRIVSLLPSATEILFAIGAGDQLVGVTHECDFPPQARALPKLTASALPASGDAAEIDRHVKEALHHGSSLYKLDTRLLDELRPDLIVTQELCAVCAVSYDVVTDAVRRSCADARVVSLEPSSIEDVLTTIRMLGAITRSEAGAASLIEKLRARLHDVRSRVEHLPRPSALVLEWTDPPMSAGHWTPGLVEIAGGVSILDNPGRNSVALAWDAIARSNPDVVIVAPCGFGMEATSRAVSALDAVPQWTNLRAVREGNVVAIDGNQYVNRPGPRLIETAELFAVALHPELRDRYVFSAKDYVRRSL